MKTRMLQFTLCALLATSLFACSEDEKPIVKPTPSPYKNLTENWHVLHNFGQAYSDMNITRYRELIDPDEFIFYFAPDEPTGSWTHDTDDQVTENMFSGVASGNPRYGKILGIDFELLFEGVQWNNVIKPGFESEVWEEAVVNYIYDFRVEPDINFINGADAKAVFTVRQVFDAANNRMEWRLVRCRDLGFIRRTAGGGGKDPMPSPVTGEQTWGQIKNLYR